MYMKLNSLDREIFNASAMQDVIVKVNGANGAHDISRNDLVSVGRLIAVEYIGRKLNESGNTKGSFESRMDSAKAYNDLATKCTQDTIMFCACMANKAIGKKMPETMEEATNLGYASDPTFLRTLAAITTDVLTPLAFNVFDDVSAGLMQFVGVGFGTSHEIEIASNDVIVFEDTSFGGARSSSYNELFNKSITLNPHPYVAQAKIKWYSNLVRGNIGQYYAAILAGLYNKIYAIFVEKLLDATTNPIYIPNALKVSTYTTANWNRITTLVAAANGIDRNRLLAYGEINPLSKVLPTDGTGAAVVGLQEGLGNEWFRRGFMPNASGVSLLETKPVIVPGTQNSTLDTIGLGTSIYIAAKAGSGYAPIYCGYFDGTPITVTMEATKTGDGTIDVTVVTMLDTKAVFGSKVGVITDVA